MTTTTPTTNRLHVNINAATSEALRSLAAGDQTSVTEIVRRAVSVYKFFADAQRRGDTIEVISPTGRIERVVIV